jgi:hypothetical protein
VTVLNPGLEATQEDETGLQLWGADPVHPLSEGYRRIIDLICREMEKKAGASRKQEGENPGGQKQQKAQGHSSPKVDRTSPTSSHCAVKLWTIERCKGRLWQRPEAMEGSGQGQRLQLA